MSKYTLQWLVLPDEASKTYTNWGDGRAGDTSELVYKVNTDPALNEGHNDWRLPTIDELRALIGTDQAPETERYWSASPDAFSTDSAWSVYFRSGYGFWVYKSYAGRVRLVRFS